jgi:hypothetical protein
VCSLQINSDKYKDAGIVIIVIIIIKNSFAREMTNLFMVLLYLFLGATVVVTRTDLKPKN